MEAAGAGTVTRTIRSRFTLADLALLVGSIGRVYRHQDRAVLRAAATELHSRGLAHLAIARALGISEQVVQQLLGEAR
jgi:hypothetical protein